MSQSQSSQSSQSSQNDEIFRILIASDIHLGFLEKHHERGDDSFRAFEEVLQMARDENVDILLLGGDLFHLNKPSLSTLEKCIQLLRRYCFGPKPIKFRIMSDQSTNFASHPNGFQYANFLDPNLNVSIPVFSIHGNHDDPTGANAMSSIETLSSAGHINYFGKYTNLDKVQLSPILLNKGECQLALYGLGSIKEERLYHVVTSGKLEYLSPENADSWFKMIVVHQNRVKHAGTKYLPEEFLSDLPDLVIWGHEHESKVNLEFNGTHGFHVYQPGSTVATSLSEGESLPKHCGLLEVYYCKDEQKHKFRLNTIKLNTVRPMVWESIDIDDVAKRNNFNDCDAIEEYCREKVRTMINRAEHSLSGDTRQPKSPLIRLRLEYSDENQKFHCAKFGASFNNSEVANPSDIISYIKKRKDRRVDDGDDDGDINLDEIRKYIDSDAFERVKIEDIINEYFGKIQDERSQLGLLSENALTLAVKDLVEKESADSILDIYNLQKEKAIESLKDNDIEPEVIREHLKQLKDEFKKRNDEINGALKESREKKRTKSKTPAKSNDNDDTDEDIFEEIAINDDDSEEEEPKGRGKGRGRGRGRGGRGSRGGRGRGNSPSKRSRDDSPDIRKQWTSTKGKSNKTLKVEFSDSD